MPQQKCFLVGYPPPVSLISTSNKCSHYLLYNKGFSVAQSWPVFPSTDVLGPPLAKISKGKLSQVYASLLWCHAPKVWGHALLLTSKQTNKQPDIISWDSAMVLIPSSPLKRQLHTGIPCGLTFSQTSPMSLLWSLPWHPQTGPVCSLMCLGNVFIALHNTSTI